MFYDETPKVSSRRVKTLEIAVPRPLSSIVHMITSLRVEYIYIRIPVAQLHKYE